MARQKLRKLWGVYQSAISKAIKQKRRVNVLILEDGKIEAEEVRPFPSKSRPEDPGAVVEG